MMWIKSCPRCKLGDMTMDEDDYRLCLECGYFQYSAAEPGVAPSPSASGHESSKR
jgi:hypothetical protein